MRMFVLVGVAVIGIASTTVVHAQTAPFDNPDRAPTLQSLSFGRVTGARNYEAVFSVGELPGVGLAPGYSLAVRVRSTGAAAAGCGPGCAVLGSRVTVEGSGYVLTEGGVERRFSADGASWREVAADPAAPFKPATATLSGGELVVVEPGGALTRRFDAAGRERTRATPWGTLTLAYDAAGRLASATNAAGAAMTLAYDAAGRLSAVTDPTGFAMTLRYAGDGHLISLEGPVDGSVTPSVSIGWSGNQITSVGRLGFNPVQVSYDGSLVSLAHDLDGTAYAFQSSATQLRVIDSSMQLRILTYDGAGRLTDDETSAGTRRKYVYDAIGRVTQIRDATEGADRVTAFAYNSSNRVTSTTDADGNVSTAEYDARGNLTRAVDPNGRATGYGYDASDRVTSVTDALGRTTTMTYDGNGLPASVTAGGITTSTTYTARGLAATTTDAFDVVTTYGYDGQGRPASVSRPGAPAVTIARSPSGSGEQVVVTRGGMSATTVTDRYGRMVSRSSTLGGVENITYDQVTGLPSGSTATFRGATRTHQQSYTNTGDTAQVWENGVMRQWAARAVMPGNAWFPAGGDGGGSGMPTGGSGMPTGGSGTPTGGDDGGSGMPTGGSGGAP